MAIELSNLTFTNQDDIVPASGVDQILNTATTNTLAGNDIINGESGNSIPGVGVPTPRGGIVNTGTLNTNSGNDILTGIFNDQNTNFFAGFGIYNVGGTIDAGDGNDIISGIVQIDRRAVGIYYQEGNINTGDGDDVITGIAPRNAGISGGLNGIINTGQGDDVITGISPSGIGIDFGVGDAASVDTGDGDDIITGVGIIGILNYAIVKTGNGKDSIIADGGFLGTGSVFLENGKDYLKGFGSGNFNGGNGQDTLELTSGSYTVGISGTTVSFTNNSMIMDTSEFEILYAGNTTYNFASLTNGQTIFVA